MITSNSSGQRQQQAKREKDHETHDVHDDRSVKRGEARRGFSS
jgi:hypothetical protein